jgi:hypothetical protein
MLIWTGLLNPKSPTVLVGGVMASALFMDAANGAAVSGAAGIYDVTQALTFLHCAVLLGSSRQPSV